MGPSGEASECAQVSLFSQSYLQPCQGDVARFTLTTVAENDDNVPQLNPLSHVCAATSAQHTDAPSKFHTVGYFGREPSTEALHQGRGTHRHECKSSQIPGFGSVDDQTQLDLGSKVGD